MGQNNIETMRRAYDLFAQGDFPRLPFDPQIEWIEPDVEGLPGSGTHHGFKAVIKDIFEPTFDKFDDFHLQCDQFLDAGDQVVVTGRFLGRGKDTGNDLNAAFAHVWTMRNGKAVRGVTDGRRQIGGDGQFAEPLMQRQPRIDRARHGNGERANVRNMGLIRLLRLFPCGFDSGGELGKIASLGRAA